MLKVYAADWCTHCTRTIKYLKKNDIEFQYIDIESQPENIVSEVIRVNGGDDWVVPTLVFNGKWRPGKIFEETELASDLKILGVLSD